MKHQKSIFFVYLILILNMPVSVIKLEDALQKNIIIFRLRSFDMSEMMINRPLVAIELVTATAFSPSVLLGYPISDILQLNFMQVFEQDTSGRSSLRASLRSHPNCDALLSLPEGAAA